MLLTNTEESENVHLSIPPPWSSELLLVNWSAFILSLKFLLDLPFGYHSCFLSSSCYTHIKAHFPSKANCSCYWCSSWKIFWLMASSPLFINLHCVRPPQIQTWYDEHVTCHGVLCTQPILQMLLTAISNIFLTNSHLPTLKLWKYNGEMIICLSGMQN